MWDWNGTLLDDVELAIDVVNCILADHGVMPMTRERYNKIFDFPVKLYYERAGLDFSGVSFETVSEQYCRNFESKLPSTNLFPNTLEMLSSVRQAGLKQYVLSGTEHNALGRMLELYGICNIFDGYRGLSDGLAHSKVESGIELLGDFSINPKSAVIVGDTIHDFEVSQAMGIDCFLISTGHQSLERLQNADCPVLTSITEFIDLLMLDS